MTEVRPVLGDDTPHRPALNLDNFFALGQDLFGIFDQQGVLLQCNPAWETVLDYSPVTLRGQPYSAFVHPEDREASQAAIATLNHGKAIAAFVNRLRHRDGTYRAVEWCAKAEEGLIYASGRDITAKQAADLDVQTLTAHLRAAQRIGRLGSWEFHLQTGAITWSEEVYPLFGFDPADGPPDLETLTQRIHPEDREYHQSGLGTGDRPASTL